MKPLALSGIIDAEPVEDDLKDGMLHDWRKEKQRLEEEIFSLGRELDDSRTQNEKLEQAIRALRQSLSPLHRAVRAIFGEIELAVGEEEMASPSIAGKSAASSGKVDVGRWGGIKQRLTKKQGELIDALILQGAMNRTQCAKAIKSDYTFCRKSVVAPLLAQGLLIEGNDGFLTVKPL